MAFQWPPTPDQVGAGAAGDRQVMSEILALGYPKVVAFYRGLGLAFHEAQDLAADVALSVVEGISRIRQPAAFEAWFWSVARNHFKAHLRKRRRTAIEPISPESMRPEEHLITSSEHGQMASAFAMLGPKDRQLLWLREVEGLSHQAIADVLQQTAGATRVAIHRARQRLADLYQELE